LKQVGLLPKPISVAVALMLLKMVVGQAGAIPKSIIPPQSSLAGCAKAATDHKVNKTAVQCLIIMKGHLICCKVTIPWVTMAKIIV